PQELVVNRSRGMPGRLRRAQFTGIAEDGEDIADHRIGQFRVGAGRWPKVSCIAGPIMDIPQNVEEVALGHASFEERFNSGECGRHRLSLEAFKMGPPSASMVSVVCM